MIEQGFECEECGRAEVTDEHSASEMISEICEQLACSTHKVGIRDERARVIEIIERVVAENKDELATFVEFIILREIRS